MAQQHRMLRVHLSWAEYRGGMWCPIVVAFAQQRHIIDEAADARLQTRADLCQFVPTLADTQLLLLSSS